MNNKSEDTETRLEFLKNKILEQKNKILEQQIQYSNILEKFLIIKKNSTKISYYFSDKFSKDMQALEKYNDDIEEIIKVNKIIREDINQLKDLIN